MNEEQIIQMIETLKQIGFDEVQATILTQLTALNKSWLRDFHVGAVIKIKNGIRLKLLLGKYIITIDIVYTLSSLLTSCSPIYIVISYKSSPTLYWDQLIEKISQTLEEI